MVNLLKIKFHEPLDWESNDVSPETMKVVPVNFGTEHKQLLSHLHVMVFAGYLLRYKQAEEYLFNYSE